MTIQTYPGVAAFLAENPAVAATFAKSLLPIEIAYGADASISLMVCADGDSDPSLAIHVQLKDEAEAAREKRRQFVLEWWSANTVLRAMPVTFNVELVSKEAQ